MSYEIGNTTCWISERHLLGHIIIVHTIKFITRRISRDKSHKISLFELKATIWLLITFHTIGYDRIQINITSKWDMKLLLYSAWICSDLTSETQHTRYEDRLNIPLDPSQPFKPSRCIKASFYILENKPNSLTTEGFWMKIFTKLVYQHMAIFFNF